MWKKLFETDLLYAGSATSYALVNPPTPTLQTRPTQSSNQ
jgi:hypothetical protein